VGNWDADEMYDSTLFAPDILYRLARDPDYGDEAARQRVRVLADRTVDFELGYLAQDIGFQALEDAVKKYRDPVEERFWPIYNLYEDGWMLMGLAYAYGITGESARAAISIS
jgi:hypothetical protein